MNQTETKPASASVQALRQRFWSRVCYLKSVRTADLIRVHHHAQQHCMAPEEAVVALGLLTEAQAIEILTGERELAATA